jgi:hypothetical protein
MSRPLTHALLALAVAAIVTCGVVGVSLLHQGHEQSAASAVIAARDFLIDGPVDQNGFEACGYLTPPQQRAASRWEHNGQCSQALDYARLPLGGPNVQNELEVERLPATVHVSGDRARVRLGDTRHGITLELVWASAAAQNEFQPPHSDWRIASGDLSLVPG